jgi:LysR family glycine cleavage system transcriptional activator
VLLDLESLRCFVSAATHLSFRTAAREIALSPAAFGERIRKLEEELGARLFERTTRRVVLTPEGVRLLPQAKRCLDEAQRCAAVVSSSEKPPFDLVIGTRFELGMSFVLPAFAALEKARPERRLHLYVGDTVDIVPRILRDEVSCMITSARIATPGLSFARLHQEDYVFVGARSLLEKRPLTKPADGRHHRLLDTSADLPLFRYFVDARSPDEVWVFESMQYLGGIGGIRARLLEGAGVAVVPLYYVRADLQAGRLKRLFATTKLPGDWFRLIWRSGHPYESELRELATEFAKQKLR